MVARLQAGGVMLDKLRKFAADNRAQAGGRDLPGVILMLGIAIVVGFLIIAIASQTIEVAGIESGDPLENASDSLETATNDVFSLLALVFLAVILSVVVFYLYGVRGMR